MGVSLGQLSVTGYSGTSAGLEQLGEPDEFAELEDRSKARAFASDSYSPVRVASTQSVPIRRDFVFESIITSR